QVGTPPIRQNEKLPENYKAKGLKEAAEKLNVLKLSGRERQEYERYLESLRDRASFYDSTYGDGHREGREEGRKEGREEGLAEGEKKGREEGQREKTLEIARNLLKSGMDPSAVAAATGLSFSAVEQLSRPES
ncbi:MAG: hypothetical protein AAF471_03570, partial [Myxococcota bacterium]